MIRNSIYGLMMILIISCAGPLSKKGLLLYPIKSNLIYPVDQIESSSIHIDFNYDDFFSHSILEYRDYSSDKNGYSADFPSKKFTQLNEQTREELNQLPNCKVVEETYLYLDNFHKKDIHRSGLAFYFITRPMTTDDRQRKYFEDSSSILMSGIRRILVGIWRYDHDDLYIVLPNKGEKALVMKSDDSLSHEQKIFINKITHPNSISNVSKKSSFNEILKSTNFIEIQKTLGFSDKNNHLAFLNINPNRKIIHDAPTERKDTVGNPINIFLGNINSIHIESINENKSKLVFGVNTKNGDFKYYYFNPLSTDFLEPDLEKKVKLIQI